MRKLALALFILVSMTCRAQKSGAPTEWLTILIHGTVGFYANMSYKAIVQIKNDCIEGSDYERKVSSVREHPYLFTLQPMQELGLQPVKKNEGTVNAAYSFATLFTKMQKYCSIREKNHFYTFGWSGLISEKRRYADATILYKSIAKKIDQFRKQHKKVRVRLIGYSHGATMLLNLADVRSQEFPADRFVIDETYLVGIPVTTITAQQVVSPLFSTVYNIYSRADKVQRLDIFSPCDFFSHRVFKGDLPDNIIQIEMRFTAHLQRKAGRCLPPNMRGMINQSPGHMELWFFGWAPSSYRKNLNMYPLPGAVFIPYLTRAAKTVESNHVIVDLRPEQGISSIRSKTDEECARMPFISQGNYAELLREALSFHPANQGCEGNYTQLEMSIDRKAYI